MSQTSVDPLEPVLLALGSEHNIDTSRHITTCCLDHFYEARMQPSGTACTLCISRERLDGYSAPRMLRAFKLLQSDTLAHPALVTLLPGPLQPPLPFYGYLVSLWECGIEGNLEERIITSIENRSYGIPAETVLPWLHNIAQAVDHLNKHGLCAGCLSLDRIFVKNGQAKLLVNQLDPPRFDRESIMDKTSDVVSLATKYVALRTGHEALYEEHRSRAPFPRTLWNLAGLEPWELPFIEHTLTDEDIAYAAPLEAWVNSLIDQRTPGNMSSARGVSESRPRSISSHITSNAIRDAEALNMRNDLLLFLAVLNAYDAGANSFGGVHRILKSQVTETGTEVCGLPYSVSEITRCVATVTKFFSKVFDNLDFRLFSVTNGLPAKRLKSCEDARRWIADFVERNGPLRYM